MKITKHGQSCLYIETEDKKILVDPGVYAFGKENEALSAADYLDSDIIIVTHEHADHFDIPTVVQILKFGKAVFISPEYVVNQLSQELESFKSMILADGVELNLSGIKITGCSSVHGPLPTGATPPEVCGVVIDDGEKRLYAPGDTTKLHKEVGNIDIVFVPICGEVVMNVEEAKSELIKLNPGLAVPYHYDNPRFPVNVNDFPPAMVGTGIEVKVLKNGESVEL